MEKWTLIFGWGCICHIQKKFNSRCYAVDIFLISIYHIYQSINLLQPHHQNPWDSHSSWSCIEWWSGNSFIFRSDMWRITGDRRHMTGDRWQVTGDCWQVTGDKWQVTGDRWQVTCDRWQLTCDRWRLTGDRWQGTGDRWQVTGRAPDKFNPFKPYLKTIQILADNFLLKNAHYTIISLFLFFCFCLDVCLCLYFCLSVSV